MILTDLMKNLLEASFTQTVMSYIEMVTKK